MKKEIISKGQVVKFLQVESQILFRENNPTPLRESIVGSQRERVDGHQKPGLHPWGISPQNPTKLGENPLHWAPRKNG